MKNLYLYAWKCFDKQILRKHWFIKRNSYFLKSEGASRLIERIKNELVLVKAVDFEGLSDQLKSTTLAVENFIGGKQTNSVMSNLESTTANIDKAMEGLRVTMENLQSFSESINENPSELFFKRPPPPRKPME